MIISKTTITLLLTKTTAAQTEEALSCYTVRGLYFLAVVFVTTNSCSSPDVVFIRKAQRHTNHITYVFKE